MHFSSPLILGSASIAGGVAGFPLRTHRERFIVRPIVTPALMARNEFRTDNLELESARGTSKGFLLHKHADVVCDSLFHTDKPLARPRERKPTRPRSNCPALRETSLASRGCFGQRELVPTQRTTDHADRRTRFRPLAELQCLPQLKNIQS